MTIKVPNVKTETQPLVKRGLVQVPNIQIRDEIMAFDGAWLPNVDPALIGANNYKELINMRYTDSGMEGIKGCEEFNTTAIVDHTDIKTGLHFRTNREDDSYLMVHAKDSSQQGEVHYSTSEIGGTAGAGAFETTAIHVDNSVGLDGRFALGPSGVVAYCNQEESEIWGGNEANVADVFTGKAYDPYNALAYPVEETEKLINRLQDSDNVVTVSTADRMTLNIMTQAPAKGFKLYISDPNTNAAATTIQMYYWNGTGLATCTTVVDGTSKLTTTGTISFDSTVGVAKPAHYQERYLYMYQIRVIASSGTSAADIYAITADMEMQKPTNIWDGVYRQPIQVQRFDSGTSTYEDFTLHVSESSTETLPVGLYLGQLAAADHIIVMFDEPMSAMRWTMLGSLVNSANAQLDATDGIQYWDGDSYANLSFTDNTLDSAGDSSFSQSGITYWDVPTDEEKTTLFGTLGYAYKISVDATLSGSAKDDVVCDILTGVPQQKDIEVYKFPAQYKNKLMMCGYVEGNEGNRIDFSADNAPNVFNGEDSSADGFQSIFVGSVEELTAATQLYNRFGSNIFSTFVILKNNEVWLMTGDSPLDYQLFPISFRVGCPAPGTLTTAEVGYTVGENVERNVAMWLSHQGPVMFDGAILHPLPGITNFFDPNEADSINWSYFADSQAWFDSTYNEWNIQIPTGSSSTLNKHLVFDVRRKKWYEKQTGLGPNWQCGIQTIATTGDQYIYAGSDDGRLYRLETGTSFDGSKILYRITTGDFFPSNNQWDVTLLRRLKFVAKRMDTDEEVIISYYKDTDASQGLSVNWTDTTDTLFADVTSSIGVAGAGVSWAAVTNLSLDLTSGSDRLAKLTKGFNQTAWSHAFSFQLESDTASLYQPIMWGYEWLYIRKDETLSYALSE